MMKHLRTQGEIERESARVHDHGSRIEKDGEFSNNQERIRSRSYSSANGMNKGKARGLGIGRKDIRMSNSGRREPERSRLERSHRIKRASENSSSKIHGLKSHVRKIHHSTPNSKNIPRFNPPCSPPGAPKKTKQLSRMERMRQNQAKFEKELGISDGVRKDVTNKKYLFKRQRGNMREEHKEDLKKKRIEENVEPVETKHLKRRINRLLSSSEESEHEQSFQDAQNIEDLLNTATQELKEPQQQTSQKNSFEEKKGKFIPEDLRGNEQEKRGPLFEVLDFRYQNKVLRSDFRLDDTWGVRRGPVTFTTKEGNTSNHECLLITKKLKNNPKRDDITLNIPVRCVPSFYVGMKKLIDEREKHFKNVFNDFNDSIEKFPLSEEGAIDLTALSHHGYPKCIVDLEWGYTLKVDEVVYKKNNLTGSYDALCISRSPKINEEEETPEDVAAAIVGEKINEKKKKAVTFASTSNIGKKDGGGTKGEKFSLCVPIRLIPALYKSVEYVYRHEFLLQGKIHIPEPSKRPREEDRIISAQELLQEEKLRQMKKAMDAAEAAANAATAKLNSKKIDNNKENLVNLKDPPRKKMRRDARKDELEISRDRASDDYTDENTEESVEFSEDELKAQGKGALTQQDTEEENISMEYEDESSITLDEMGESIDERESFDGNNSDTNRYTDEKNKGGRVRKEDHRVFKEWKKNKYRN